LNVELNSTALSIVLGLLSSLSGNRILQLVSGFYLWSFLSSGCFYTSGNSFWINNLDRNVKIHQNEFGPERLDI